MATAPTDDPEIASCKSKLNQFRIKELKDVLHELGLSRQGKKQELLDRLTSVLCCPQDQETKMDVVRNKSTVGRERLVKIVEDTFRKMQDPTNSVAASRSQVDSGHSAKSKKKPDGSPKLDTICSCPCGNSIPNDSMIKCVDLQCNIWQHVSCVIVLEKPADNSAPELPSSFYCEICRISKADPFCVTIHDPLPPILIAPSIITADGSYMIRYTAKSFTLSRAHKEMLQKAEYDLQVWCILLNDKVPFRMHWPLHSNMHVNGVHVRVVNRQPTQQLGANGRDDGSVITDYVQEGSNKIGLSANDTRTFCLGIRIVRRRSLEQVLNLVPKEQDGEKFDDALNRVRHCVGGGTEANNADSDNDIEVMAESVSVNVRCPMTASRIRVAGRFKPCAHMGCFDLEAFIEINQRSRKWQCPICLKNYSLENIIIDPYFNRITSLIQSCGDDTTEIDVRPDGSWRVKGGPELKELAKWHLPVGTLCMATDLGATSNVGAVKHEAKEEPLSKEPGCHLKLGIRKNSNGQWQIRKKALVSSSDGDRARHLESNKSCATLTSTIDNEGDKEGSCTSEPGRNDCSVSHVHDLESSPAGENVPPSPRERDVIVLSDSDDDDIVTVSSPKAVNCGSVPNPLETSGVDGEGLNETTYFAVKECFGDLGLSFWDFPPVKDQSKHESASGGDESLVTAKNASQKRKKSEGGRTALDASILGCTDDDALLCPSSSPQKQRPVRPRLITIDSDTD